MILQDLIADWQIKKAEFFQWWRVCFRQVLIESDKIKCARTAASRFEWSVEIKIIE